MDVSTPPRPTDLLPWRDSARIALPLIACMAVLGVPDWGRTDALLLRLVLSLALAAWLLPLAALLRWGWRRGLSPLWQISLTGGACYAMSVLNSLLLRLVGPVLGWGPPQWSTLFRGLDSCWWMLIAYSALHAVMAQAAALARERQHKAEALAAEREARLQALRHQLHPHVLFNTLNAISGLVMAGRSEDATQMIARLGDFLRGMLHRSASQEHALAEELALAEDYLAIEQMRVGERLQFECRVGPDLLGAAVPVLLLQPLLENALKHGVSPRVQPTRVSLSIEASEGQLSVCLRNQTPTPGRAALQPGLGLGLRQVRERLATLYGAHQRVEAGHDAEGWFAVNLRLPLRQLPAAAAAAALQAAA